MLIEFNKKQNFYDDLKNKLYGTEFNDKLCYNFTPIEIYGVKYILTSSKNLEGYLMDYNKNVKIKLYIKINDNDCECICLKLSNIVVFGSEIEQQYINENQSSSQSCPDCYIDTINDLLLIKFNSSKLNYIKIYNNFNCDEDLRYDEENINLRYTWTDKHLNQQNINKTCKIINMWNYKYINLPPIPVMINIENNECKPITGSQVFDNNDNFLGMVSYTDTDKIQIIPLISIKKICDNLLDFKTLYLGINFQPINFNFKSGLNKIDYSHGLLITNNYYDSLVNAKKKIEREIQKIKRVNNITDDDLLNTKYLAEEIKFLFENKNYTNCEQNERNDIFNNHFTLHRLKKKNNSIQIDNEYSNLKMGNIICSIDGYKINSSGNMIIDENESLIDGEREKKYKSIPVKSYIWLFKNSRNNIISLKNISQKNYRCDLINLYNENGETFIDDSCIKKQVNIIETRIQIKTNYNSVSSLGLGELKYITYNYNSTSIQVVELNEKIMEIIKHFLVSNIRIYKNIINYVLNNNYTIDKNKILLLFKFNNEISPTIKIISKNVVNYDDILNKYKTNKELKDFLISQT